MARRSIATTLPLGLSLLLAAVVGAMAVAGYVDVRAEARNVGAVRISRAGQRVADIVTAGLPRGRAALQTQASSADVLALVTKPGAATIAAVRKRLERPDQPNTVEFWNAQRDRVLVLGPQRAPFDPADAGALASLAQAGPVSGPFLERDGAVMQRAIAPVLAHDVVAGYIVDWRPMANSGAETLRLLKELIGDEPRLLVGNATGDVWSDFAKSVEAPPEGVLREMLDYRRDGLDVFGAATAIAGTPWVMLVELPAAAVLQPVRRFTARAGAASVVLVAFGTALGWW